MAPDDSFATFGPTSGNNKRVLVLDNLESARDDPSLLKELADVITLLDDPRYADYKVSLLIVGVPGDLRKYYQDTPNLSTVANRLRELPEVARLDKNQCADLVRRGFCDELKYKIEDVALSEISKRATWVTDGLPQRLHEYCLELAKVLWEYKEAIKPCSLVDSFKEAESRWLGVSLNSNYTVIESLMNERRTKIGRRNQILYVLGSFETDEFKTHEVERKIRQEFPETASDRVINTSQILSGLVSAIHPILKPSPKGDAFCFTDPKYRLCIRSMLKKRPDETIERLPAIV